MIRELLNTVSHLGWDFFTDKVTRDYAFRFRPIQITIVPLDGAEIFQITC